MIRSSRSRWISGIGAMVLAGGLWMAGDGTGVTPAGAKDLNGVTPNWDQNLPSASRFTTVFTGAVRDNNTGLVWERAPDATLRAWQSFSVPLGATNYCVSKNVGGTRGWRLPSVAELVSLIDPSLPAPFVPASAFAIGGAPGVQSTSYWSASTVADDPAHAWDVGFNDGLMQFGTGGVFKGNKAQNSLLAWCVRGGMNADQY